MNDTHAPDAIIKPKGSAIPGLDYGIDMLDEATGTDRAPVNPESGSENSDGRQTFQMKPQHQPPPRQPNSMFRQQLQTQTPRFNPQPQYQQQESMMEGSMGSGSGGGSFSGSSYDSGSEEEMSEGSGSSGSDNGGLLPPGFQVPQEAPLTYEQRRERKINALAALRRLEEAGYLPAGDKKFSFASELAEIEDTVERLKLQRDLDSSIKFQRKFLIGFANVVEFVCTTEYNIFDLKLEGWSDSIFENITDYDEVFEELYYKYKDSVAIMPEVKLVMMVGGSAMMFHMSRELFSKTSSKVPGFDEVMARDPELKRRYTDVAANIAKDRGMPMPSKQDGGAGFMKSMFSETMNKFPKMAQQQGNRPPPQMQQQQRRVPMSEPDDIDGLLGSLTGGGRRKQGPPQDEIDLSEIENLSDLA
jgi:hypothetical protein